MSNSPDPRYQPNADLTHEEIIKLASGIIQRHGLNSTATREERSETIERFSNWWCFIALPAINPQYKVPHWFDLEGLINNLRRHSKI